MIHGDRTRVFLRRACLLPLLAIALLLTACAGDFPQNAMAPKSDFAQVIDNLFWTIIYWSIGVFIVVESLLVYALIRFRRRPGQPVPAQVHGNTRLEIAWTLAPALVLASIAVPTVRTIFETQAPPTADALQVQIIGHQWWWEVRYPQLNVVTANEVRLPLGRKADISITSADVIHSFWIPKLGGKRDANPGRTNRISLTPFEPGVYWGQCAEFCGASHANMGLRAVVEEPAAFEAWARAQQAPAPDVLTQPDANPLVKQGAQQFVASACLACHRIAGTPAAGRIGPDLTHIGSRRTIAAGMMENTPENLARWLRNPPEVKPGALMPNLNLSEDAINALVAYLGSLK